MAESSTEHLLQRDHVYEYHKRPRRDTVWLVLYLMALLINCCIGFYGFLFRNNNFWSRTDAAILSDPRSCPKPGGNFADPRQSDLLGHAKGDVLILGLWLWASAVASLFLGLVYLFLFRRAPKTMVHITIYLQVLLPLVVSLPIFRWGHTLLCYILLGAAALMALSYFLMRDSIELCAGLLCVSAQGLNKNPALVLFAILCKLAMGAVFAVKLVLLGLAYTNGQLVPTGAQVVSNMCTDSRGSQVRCCEWHTAPWVKYYAIWATITFAWTLMLFSQLRLFVLSGTITQWYFSPPNMPGATKGTTLRAVGHALGPSFGSLAFSAALLTLLDTLRYVTGFRRSPIDMDVSLSGSMFSCLLSALRWLLQTLTRFAAITCAITGESLLAAGKRSTRLLSRNMMDSYNVWTFPPVVLQLASFLVSAAWGTLIYFVYTLATHAHPRDKKAALLGGFSFVAGWIVLAFFSSMLLDIVNTVYICYAIDMDNEVVTNAEVHEIYAQVPKGTVVEQPDGDILYGAPKPPTHAYAPLNDTAF